MLDNESLLLELAKLSWASTLSEESRRALAESVTPMELGTGDIVVRPGSSVDNVSFIIQGRLSATVRDAFGNMVLERTLTRGMAIGIFAMALGEDMTLEVVATERALIYQMPTLQLLQLTARFHDLQMVMFRLAAGNVRSMVLADRVCPHPTVVGVLHQSQTTRWVTEQLVLRLRSLDETITVAGDDSRWMNHREVSYQLWYRDGALIPEEERQAHVQEWRGRGRVLFDLDAEHNPNDLARLLSYADTILWCVTPREAEQAVRSIRKLLAIDPGWGKKIRLVWVLDPQTTFSPFLPELQQLPFSFKVATSTSREGAGQLINQGIERLVRHLRGVCVGIALGGGAARGMAHLGVLKALEQHGIFVDMIAGTSAGAMTGTIYAAGMDPEFSTQCFKNDLKLSWFFKSLPGGGYWYLLHQYRRNRFDPMLRKYLDNAQMDQLVVPMHTISVDLVEGKPLIRSTGDAVRNILESINLPPLSLPIVNSGQAIVDGGLLNNVPADVLVANGCNFVIASTVTATLEKDFMGIRSTGKVSKHHFLASIQVLMRQNLIQSYNMNHVGVQPADVVIAPDVTAFDLSEFTRADEMAVVGEATTQDKIPTILAMLQKLDPKLFANHKLP
jgi:predicted acylesterase/phospholipase RssA/CRP-like cAMP-binding protein